MEWAGLSAALLGASDVGKAAMPWKLVPSVGLASRTANCPPARAPVPALGTLCPRVSIAGSFAAAPGWSYGRLPHCLHSIVTALGARAQEVASWYFCLWRQGLESSKPLSSFLRQGHPSSRETID